MFDWKQAFHGLGPVEHYRPDLRCLRAQTPRRLPTPRADDHPRRSCNPNAWQREPTSRPVSEPQGMLHTEDVQAREGEAMNHPITAEPGISELDQEDGRAMLEERAKRLVGMSLEEFEAAYDAGKLDLESRAVRHLIMLLPFAR